MQCISRTSQIAYVSSSFCLIRSLVEIYVSSRHIPACKTPKWPVSTQCCQSVTLLWHYWPCSSVLQQGNLNFDYEILQCFSFLFSFYSGIISMFQLDSVGWQLNLQMAQSSQASLKCPSAVLQLGLTSDDSEVRTHTSCSGCMSCSCSPLVFCVN